MIEALSKLEPWDESNLIALLTLEKVRADRFRNRHGDANLNGRSYGGQTLGQALMAASLTATPDRVATTMQFVFLQGADPERPIDFEVTRLQDGKRFSSRQVRGMQGSHLVFNAQVTFALPLAAPEHQTASAATERAPDDVPSLPKEPWPWEPALRRLGGYSLREKACMEFRIPDADHQVVPEFATARLRYWLKSRQALPAEAHIHAAAFAYLSDWWLNFSSLGPHVRDLRADRRLYISSLNHCIWFHRPLHADDWLHFDCESPCAADGRGLSVARVHDRQGRLVASATQECLMAFA